jgi:hypothetical protein
MLPPAAPLSTESVTHFTGIRTDGHSIFSRQRSCFLRLARCLFRCMTTTEDETILAICAVVSDDDPFSEYFLLGHVSVQTTERYRSPLLGSLIDQSR